MKNCFKIFAMIFAGFLLTLGAWYSAFADSVSSKVCTDEIEGLCSDVAIYDFGLMQETGRTYAGEIVVKNNSDTDAEFDVETIEYPDDTLPNEYKQAVEWISFVGGVKHYKVAAKNEVRMRIRAVLPNTVADGTYYAKITVSGSNDDYFEVGTKMTVAKEGGELKGKVRSNSILPVVLDKKLKTKVKVANDGTAAFTARYNVEIVSAGNDNEKYTYSVSEDVYPDSDRELSFEKDVEALFGVYNAKTMISYVDENGDRVEESAEGRIFVMPLWIVFVAGGVVLAIIVLMVVLKTVKRNKKADEESSESKEENSLD